MLKLDDSNWEIYINFMLFRYLNFHNKRVNTLKNKFAIEQINALTFLIDRGVQKSQKMIS